VSHTNKRSWKKRNIKQLLINARPNEVQISEKEIGSIKIIPGSIRRRMSLSLTYLGHDEAFKRGF
jgi:hypothetical protein